MTKLQNLEYIFEFVIKRFTFVFELTEVDK